MDVPFGLILLAGKYLFAAALYGFVVWAMKSLFDELAAERQAGRRVGGPVPAVAPVVASAPALVPEAAPAPVSAPPSEPVAPAPPVSPLPPRPFGSPPPALSRGTLVVVDAGEAGLRLGEVHELTAAVTIGRLPDNGIVIQDRFCSSHHAMVFLLGGKRVLRDRQSTNGTLHNGRRVTADVQLTPGDRITVGTVTFEYRAPAVQQ